MKGKVKIAVLVSGGGTNLQALIDAEKSGTIKSGKITLVISNNADAYALTRAKNAGIETRVITKAEYGRNFEKELISAVKAAGGNTFVTLFLFSLIVISP